MSDRSESAGDSETVAAVLDRLEGLTREQWLERLNWVPEGLEHQRSSVAALGIEPVCQAEAIPVVSVTGDVARDTEPGEPFARPPQRKKKLHA